MGTIKDGAGHARTRIKTVYRPIEPPSRTVKTPSAPIDRQFLEIPQAVHVRGVRHRDAGHRSLPRVRTL